jgi:hypothetical protein
MRKTIMVFLCVTIAALAAFANGNAEKITSLEGIVLVAQSEGAPARIMLRTAEGEDVIVDMPAKELLRLQLREQERLRVDGVFIGAPSAQQGQARILARVINVNGEEFKIEEPVRLTARDRSRIRAYEAEQTRLQTRDQTQEQTQDQAQVQTQAQLREAEATRSGSSSGKKSGNK